MTGLKKTPYTIMIILAMIAVISYFAQYLFNIMLSHLLSSMDYGDFSVGLKTFGLVSSFLLLGSGTASKRFLSRYLFSRDNASAEQYMLWSLKIFLLSSFIFMIFLMLLFIVMLLLHLGHIYSVKEYHIAVYLLFLTPFGALALLLNSFLQSNNNVVLNAFFLSGRFFVYIFVRGLASYFFHPTVDNKFLFLLTLIVFCLLNCIELIVLFLCLPRSLINTLISIKDYQFVKCPIWKKTSGRLILNQLIFLTLSTIDLYAVKFFNHTQDGLGQYAAILTISGITWLITNNTYSFLAPKISTMIANQGIETPGEPTLQMGINRGNAINLLMGSIVTFLLLFFGYTLLRSFGHTYATQVSYVALAILVIGNFLASFCRSSTLILAYSGNELWLIYGSIGELILIVVLASILTIFYGIIGTALATAITVCTKAIFYIMVVRRTLQVKPVSLF